MEFLNMYSWVVESFLVVFVAAVLNIAIAFAIRKVTGRIVGWFRGFLEALRMPLYYFIWVCVGFYLIDVFLGLQFLAITGKIFNLITIAITSWFLFRWRKEVEKRLVLENKDRYVVNALGRAVTIVIIIIATLMVLDTIGVEVSTILAFGGIGGIAVGFAAKDVVANFFGGIMIYLTRPFSTGDLISSPDRKIEGVVDTVGWYQTLLYTLDKQPVYVPNALFSTIVLVNPSRRRNRRINDTIGIRYQDFSCLEDIVSDINKFIATHSGVDHNQNIFVAFTSFGASSLDILVSCYTIATLRKEFLEVKQNILLEVGKIIASHGAGIAFPTTTLDLPDGAMSRKG